MNKTKTVTVLSILILAGIIFLPMAEPIRDLVSTSWTPPVYGPPY